MSRTLALNHSVNYFTLCKGIRFQNLGNFCLYESGLREKFVLESGILGFGIRNTAQGIRKPTDNWNPKSKCVTYSIVDLLDNLPGANVESYSNLIR